MSAPGGSGRKFSGDKRLGGRTLGTGQNNRYQGYGNGGPQARKASGAGRGPSTPRADSYPSDCPICDSHDHQASKCPYKDDCHICLGKHLQHECPCGVMFDETKFKRSALCFQCGSSEHDTKSCMNHDGCNASPRQGYHFKWECSAASAQEKAHFNLMKNPPINAKALVEQQTNKPLPTYKYTVRVEKSDADHLLNLSDSARSLLYDSPSKDIRFGSGGKDVQIVSNYIKTTLPKTLFQYDVSYGKVARHVKPETSGSEARSKASSVTDLRSVESRTEKERVFAALAGRSELAGCQWATDYQKLWCLQPLALQQNQRIDDIAYTKPNGRAEMISYVQLDNRKDFSMPNGSRDLVGGASVDGMHPTEAIAALNAIISRHIHDNSGESEIAVVGLNKFFVKGGVKTLGIVDATRGYSSSVRPGYNDVLLNINTATTAFYHPMIVSAFLGSVHQSDYDNAEALLKNRKVRLLYNINSPKNASEEPEESFDPNKESNRKRVIAGLGRPCHEQVFLLDGKKTTVKDYFASKYKIELRFPNLRAVNVGLGPDKETKAQIAKLNKEYRDNIPVDKEPTNARANWIPPELLEIEPDQPFGRRLGPNDTRGMINCALRHPAANQHLIQAEALKSIMKISHKDQSLGSLEMTVNNKLIMIPGRVLNAPQIAYRSRANSQNQRSQTPGCASWDLGGDAVFWKAPSIEQSVCFIDFRHGNLMRGRAEYASAEDAREKLVGKLQLRNPSLTVNNGKTCTKADSRQISRNFPDALRILGNPSIVLIILPDRSEDAAYAEIKSIADRELGVHTICVTNRKLQYRQLPNGRKALNDSTFDYLALKFNMKLGGQNHFVGEAVVASKPDQTELKPSVEDDFTKQDSKKGKSNNRDFAQTQHKQFVHRPKGESRADTAGSDQAISLKSAFDKVGSNTIIFGADVTHPAGGAMSGCPSIASVVANVDDDVSNFPGSVRVQQGRTEIIADLEAMVLERLRAWQETHDNRLPDQVIFYRDGVSESQYEDVQRLEIKAVRDAFRTAGKSTAIQITFIVCGKRHNTRFFPTEASQSYEDGKGIPATAKDGTLMNGNIKPGLVVDEVITRPPANAQDGTFDFFLQSHAALRGTARSCHYVVLENGADFKAFTADELQQLTHALCYSYATATKGISYAAPAYYADKLCTRGRQYLAPMFNGTVGTRTDIRRTEPVPVMKDDDKIEDFRDEVVKWVKKQPEWKPKGGRTNPWAPEMDNVMFYL